MTTGQSVPGSFLTYVMNNPLAMVDPLGMDGVCVEYEIINYQVVCMKMVDVQSITVTPDDDPRYAIYDASVNIYQPNQILIDIPQHQTGGGAADNQLNQLLNKLSTCPAASGMVKDLKREQASGKLIVKDLGPYSGGVSFSGTVTIDINDVSAHTLGHEWFHLVQMDRTMTNAGGWPGWVGARLVNTLAGCLHGDCGFGPLDKDAEAVGQWISSQCGID